MILAVSPHLDDVVFSCGGYLNTQARAGTRVQCLTVFTRSVRNPTGFALACQLDKGLTAEVDYMALRRAEDREACRLLDVEPIYLDYREAPHRGYVSAPDLFAGTHDDDPFDAQVLSGDIALLLINGAYTEVLYPYGAGNHVDHLQVIAAVDPLRVRFPAIRFRQYYDMPYARKFRERYPEMGTTVPGVVLDDTALQAKLTACAAYTTQVGFQFGDTAQMVTVLGDEEYFVG